jgi:hypothetical protein
MSLVTNGLINQLDAEYVRDVGGFVNGQNLIGAFLPDSVDAAGWYGSNGYDCYLKDNAITIRPSLYFNTGVISPQNTNKYLTYENLTVIIAARRQGPAWNNQWMGLYSSWFNYNKNGASIFAITDNANTGNFDKWGTYGGITTTQSTSAMGVNVPVVLSTTFSSSGSGTFYTNGSNSGTYNSTTDQAYFGVGGLLPAKGSFVGDIFEVLVYNRILSEAEIQNSTSYLINKWFFYPSPTPSVTPTPTPTVTPSVSITPTPSVSITSTPSLTPTQTPSITPSVTPSETPSVTPSVTPSETPSVTPSVTPSITPSETPSVTPSVTPSITPSETPSVTPSITVTPTTTVTPSPSLTPSETPSVTPSTTPPSLTPSVTPSITPSITPSETPTVTPSVTPSITVTPSISITPTVTPSITITPSITPTPVTDTLRASLTGTASLTAYDAASVNSWVRVTGGEYAATMINVAGATKYWMTDALMSQPVAGGWSANFAQIISAGSVSAIGPIGTNNYLIGFSTRNTTVSGSVALLSASTYQGTYSIVNGYVGLPGTASPGGVYYIRKAPTLVSDSNIHLGIVHTNTVQLITTGLVGGYDNTVPYSTWSSWSSSFIPIQAIATTTKSW